MGDKISALPAAAALAGTEAVPIVQSGATVKTTVAAIGNAATGVRTVATGGTGLATWTSGAFLYASGAGTLASATTVTYSGTSLANAGSIKSSHATAGVGYATGAGSTVTQTTNRTTGVTINAACGAITLFSAAGSATPATFTVSNSAVAATDIPQVVQKSGADLYDIKVTAVGAGSFNITFNTTGGTTTEQPVFSFAILKGAVA